MKNSNYIDFCLACVVACEKCSTDCINNGRETCALLCRDCADICALCARFELRESEFSQYLCLMCAKVCKTCAKECLKHAAHLESCKDCAEACKECEAVCLELTEESN